MRRSLEVLELAAIERPPEDRADGEYQRNRKRDQQIQDFHEATLYRAVSSGRPVSCGAGWDPR